MSQLSSHVRERIHMPTCIHKKHNSTLLDNAVWNVFLVLHECVFLPVQDVVDWYMAIRNVKFMRLRIGLPHVAESELLQRLTPEFVLEGWLYKTGTELKDAWRRRWFTLDRRRLLYFDDPLVSVRDLQ